MIHLVVFTCGGCSFGIEAARIAGMGRVDQLPVSGWKQVDLAALGSAGLPFTPLEAAECYLQFRGMHDTTVLLLERRARLIEFDAAQIWPLPAILEQAKQHRCIKALACHEDGPILLLEPALLPTL